MLLFDRKRAKRQAGEKMNLHVIRHEADIASGLSELSKLDERLESVIRKAGPVPLRLAQPGYEGLANIIVSQMISKAAADSVWTRLKGVAGGTISAGSILLLDEPALRSAGLSGAKAQTLARAASAVGDGSIDLDHICQLDAREACRQMMAIKGIGLWTAEVYLMFCAGHADIFPSGDVALQNAVGHAFGQEERPKDRQLRQMAELWQPWRSVAARLFWAYYATEMRREADPFA
jgi:DNA-3-methyladenine glycosylase II